MAPLGVLITGVCQPLLSIALQRAKKLKEMYPEACEHLVCGRADSPALKEIKHPVTYDARSRPEYDWKVSSKLL